MTNQLSTAQIPVARASNREELALALFTIFIQLGAECPSGMIRFGGDRISAKTREIRADFFDVREGSSARIQGSGTFFEMTDVSDASFARIRCPEVILEAATVRGFEFTAKAIGSGKSQLICVSTREPRHRVVFRVVSSESD